MHVRMSLPAPNRHGTMSNMQPGFRDKSSTVKCQTGQIMVDYGLFRHQTGVFPFGDLEGAHVCPSKRQFVSRKQFGRSVTVALSLSV